MSGHTILDIMHEHLLWESLSHSDEELLRWYYRAQRLVERGAEWDVAIERARP